MHVAPGTIVVWSDIACPWATLAVQRLHATRARLGLDGRVRLDHRAFPLELFNEQPTPKEKLAEEVRELGLPPWRGPDDHWPVTTLPALEAVQAAKDQSLEASEQLDLALRRAFFFDSQCISLRHVILGVAERCPGVDVDRLRKAIDDGRARRTVIEHWERAEHEGVQGSPHLFLQDATAVHNPEEPSAFEDLVRRAAG